jgi:phospholipase/carboxylesterase
MLHESSPYKSMAPSVTTNRRLDADTSIALEFPFRLFVPENYEPNYAYPLVVWMHSDSSSELELDEVMCALSRRNYVGISPRANLLSKGGRRRYRWGKTNTDCAVAEDLVWECVQAAMENLSIHPDRIFLAGFGGGGTMAQWIGLKYSAQVAGVVSLSGPFPKAPRALANWKAARNLDVLFTQCQESTICPNEEMVRAVKIAHQSGLKYRFWHARSEGPGSSADELDVSMLEAANRFMMGIVTGSDLNLAPESSANIPCVEFGSN